MTSIVLDAGDLRNISGGFAEARSGLESVHANLASGWSSTSLNYGDRSMRSSRPEDRSRAVMASIRERMRELEADRAEVQRILGLTEEDLGTDWGIPGFLLPGVLGPWNGPQAARLPTYLPDWGFGYEDEARQSPVSWLMDATAAVAARWPGAPWPTAALVGALVGSLGTIGSTGSLSSALASGWAMPTWGQIGFLSGLGLAAIARPGGSSLGSVAAGGGVAAIAGGVSASAVTSDMRTLQQRAENAAAEAAFDADAVAAMPLSGFLGRILNDLIRPIAMTDLTVVTLPANDQPVEESDWDVDTWDLAKLVNASIHYLDDASFGHSSTLAGTVLAILGGVVDDPLASDLLGLGADTALLAGKVSSVFSGVTPWGIVSGFLSYGAGLSDARGLIEAELEKPPSEQDWSRVYFSPTAFGTLSGGLTVVAGGLALLAVVGTGGAALGVAAGIATAGAAVFKGAELVLDAVEVDWDELGSRVTDAAGSMVRTFASTGSVVTAVASTAAAEISGTLAEAKNQIESTISSAVDAGANLVEQTWNRVTGLSR